MIRPAARALFAALCFTAMGAAAQPVVSYSISGAKFEDIRDNVKLAIESRGLVVDYQAQVGRMLERTGADVGSTRKVYVDAQTLQFCSARLSRRMMEADPANAVFCPYSIVVYATAAKPDEVIVTYRRALRPGGGPASMAVLAEVDALLDGIAREAVGRK